MFLPLCNTKDYLKFRKKSNILLQQHPYVGIPELPNWILFDSETKNVPLGVLMCYKKQFSFGLHLIVILEDGQGAMLDLKTGLWNFIGKCSKCIENCIILIADVSKNNNDLVFGAHFTFIDTYIYDNINLIDSDFFYRFEITKTMKFAIQFPQRFTTSIGIIPQPGQIEDLHIYTLM